MSQWHGWLGLSSLVLVSGCSLQLGAAWLPRQMPEDRHPLVYDVSIQTQSTRKDGPLLGLRASSAPDHGLKFQNVVLAAGYDLHTQKLVGAEVAVNLGLGEPSSEHYE